MRLLSTPTVSSVPGEYNYFSAVANVIITAVASRYCILFTAIIAYVIDGLGTRLPHNSSIVSYTQARKMTEGSNEVACSKRVSGIEAMKLQSG